MIKLGGLIDAHWLGDNKYRLPNGQIVDSKTYLFMEQEASKIESRAEKAGIESIQEILNTFGRILKG